MLVNFKDLLIVLTLVLGVQCSSIKRKEDEVPQTEQDRSKRELTYSSPIYYDQPQLPVKPKPPLSLPQQQQQPQQSQQQPQPENQLQGLPIIGALISNVPGLNGISSTVTTLVPLGTLGNGGNLVGLGNLGNLGNLGGLGNLGALGNLGGLGSLGGNLGNLGALGNLGSLSNLGGLSSFAGNLGNLGGLGGLGNTGGLGNLGGLPGYSPTQLPQLGNIGGLGNLGSLNNLGGLSSLGGNLGNLGGLGGLGNTGGLGNLGGLASYGQTQLPQQQCPLAQALVCRCENLLPLPIKPLGAKTQDSLEIVQQNMKLNKNGEKEISVRLSNGLLLYQRTGIEKLSNNQNSKVIHGYYTLQIKDNKYLTIDYTINDLDYTVKADVTAEPPRNDLDESTPVNM